MTRKLSWAASGSTTLFVLLWSSGAIFSKLALEHASAFALLILRFALAGGVLAAFGAFSGRALPDKGTRLRVMLTGLLLIGSYSSCYFLALERGLTPGELATILGVQPILTLLLVERRFALRRLAGLAMALCGLVLVLYQSIGHSIDTTRVSIAGMAFALAALASTTAGAILQKGASQAPVRILPLQYAASLVLCCVLAPFQELSIDFSADLLLSLLWLAIVISVIAQLLLYRMIQAGNLVNVTSLFYLVPVCTVAMDYIFLGNRPSLQSLTGMMVILAGLALVLRSRSSSSD